MRVHCIIKGPGVTEAMCGLCIAGGMLHVVCVDFTEQTLPYNLPPVSIIPIVILNDGETNIKL